jgi:hypothetical protein
MEKEFKDIGKKMPYSVPDGFFDSITGVTLEKARRRERADRKKRVFFQWLAAAAVLTGIALAGVRLLGTQEVASPEIAGTPLEIPAQEGIIKPGSGSLTNHEGSSVLEKPASPKSMEFVKSTDNEESVDELLASIPDEELLKWALLVDNDPFSEETENNAYHENN